MNPFCSILHGPRLRPQEPDAFLFDETYTEEDPINPLIYHDLVITNSLPWKDPPFLIGKPSISMGHLYHGYVK